MKFGETSSGLSAVERFDTLWNAVTVDGEGTMFSIQGEATDTVIITTLDNLAPGTRAQPHRKIECLIGELSIELTNVGAAMAQYVPERYQALLDIEQALLPSISKSQD